MNIEKEQALKSFGLPFFSLDIILLISRNFNIDLLIIKENDVHFDLITTTSNVRERHVNCHKLPRL